LKGEEGMVFFFHLKKRNLEGGKGVGRGFFFSSLFVTLLLFGSFLLLFVYSQRGRGHEFF